MRDGDELYVDVKQKPRRAEIKSESDLICSNIESSGSYKCIKCCKVRLPMFTAALPYQTCKSSIVLIFFEFAEMLQMILVIVSVFIGDRGITSSLT